MKKLVALFVGVLIGWNSVAIGATILFPSGGGTGTSTAPSYGQLLVGNRGGTYTLTSTSSLGIVSGVGSGASTTILADGNHWTGLNQYTAGIISLASSTFQTLNFGGVTGTSWSDFCTAITGGAGLCDGVDNTAAGGAGVGTVATSSLETKGGLPYWTTNSGYPATLGSVATTSVSCSGSTSCTSFTAIGGSPITISSTDSTASSTILSDGNTFSGLNRFTNGIISLASSTFQTLNLSGLSGVLKISGNTVVGSASTSDVPEGTNSYWTSGRSTTSVSALIAGTTTTALAEGNNLYYTLLRWANAMAGTTTTALAEGNNLYYTAQRVRDLIQSAGTLLVGTTTANTWSATQSFSDISLSNGTSTAFVATGQASTSQLTISNRLSFGGVSGTAWSAFCTAITGGAGLCDGTDDGGAGSGTVNSGTLGQSAYYASAGTAVSGTSSIAYSDNQVDVYPGGGVAGFFVSRDGSAVDYRITTADNSLLQYYGLQGSTSFDLRDNGVSGNRFYIGLGSPNTVPSYIRAGNFGIGTSSPYARLAVAGRVVGEYFTATGTDPSFLPFASTTVVSGDRVCIGSDCRSAWPSSGSASSTLLSDGNNWSALNKFTNGIISIASSTIQTLFSTNIFSSGSTTLGSLDTSSSTLGVFLARNGTTTNLNINGQLTVTGTASSTFSGGLQATNGRFSALTSCDTIDTDANGVFRCGTDASGSGTWPWTVSTTYNASANATTTPYWAQGALYASSTVIFGNGAGTELVWNSTNGHLGLNGTTTPWADLSIKSSDDSTSPVLAIATSSDFSSIGLISNSFSRLATLSTKNWFRTFLGGATSSERFGLFQNNNLMGITDSDTLMTEVDPLKMLTNTNNAVTANTHLGNGAHFIAETDGSMALTIWASSTRNARGSALVTNTNNGCYDGGAWVALQANTSAGSVAAEGASIRGTAGMNQLTTTGWSNAGDGFLTASSNPKMIVTICTPSVTTVQPSGATTSAPTSYYFGFIELANYGATISLPGTQSRLLIATSTENWVAVTTGAAATTGNRVDTGISTTTTTSEPTTFGIAVTATSTYFYRYNHGTGQWNSISTISTNQGSKPFSWVIGVQNLSTYGQRPFLYVRNLKVWYSPSYRF